jgi:hypothetical protein
MKDLILSDLGNSLTSQPAEYKSMLKNIDAKMPAVEQGITLTSLIRSLWV